MENYSIDELRALLDQDDPLPAPLRRKQIREWLEEQAATNAVDEEKKRADAAELKLKEIELKLEGLRRVMEVLGDVELAYALIEERKFMASFSCKRSINLCFRHPTQ
jgi:hypothetical protein